MTLNQQYSTILFFTLRLMLQIVKVVEPIKILMMDFPKLTTVRVKAKDSMGQFSC